MNSYDNKSEKISVPENELVESLEHGNSNTAARKQFHVQHSNGTQLIVPTCMSLSNVFANLANIEESITKMEILGLTDDERYQQLKTLRAIYHQSTPQKMLHCYAKVAAMFTFEDNSSIDNPDVVDVDPESSSDGFAGFCNNVAEALPGIFEVPSFQRYTEVNMLQAEREVCIQQVRMTASAQFINETIANLSPACRLPAEITLKSLLLQAEIKLCSLRIKSVTRARNDKTLQTDYGYKRCKSQTVNEARTTDYMEAAGSYQLERQIAAPRKERLKKIQKFVAAVCECSAKFCEYNPNRNQEPQFSGTSVLIDSNKALLQKREQERLERECLLRLMEDDEEVVNRQLIDQKKEKRLTYLLKQIEEYIERFMEMAKQHYQVEQQRKPLQQCQLIKQKNELLRNGNFECLDEQSAVGGLRVDVRERATGEMLTGNAAPKLRELTKWLQEHQGWTWVLSKDCVEATNLQNEEIKTGLNNVEDEYREEAQYSYYTVVHNKCDPIVLQPTLLVNGQLKEYQLKGLQWLVSLYNNNLNGILADEMGLGKTIQIIALIAYLVERKNNHGPFLIVVPLSTLSNWFFEFQKWLPSVNVLKYKGGLAMRRQLQKQMRRQQLNVVLTTFEYAVRDKAALSKWTWQFLIVDEGHRMKNHEYKMANTLNNNYDVRHRLLLTGTPLQNNLSELWSLLNFLHPSIFQSCDTFEQWFNAPFVKTGEKVELNEEENVLIVRRLHKVLSLFLLRRLKNEVAQQLPEKTEYVLKCEMSALQRILYKHMQNTGKLLNNVKSKNSNARVGTYNSVSAGTLNRKFMQLRKLCNHPFLFPLVKEKYGAHIGCDNDDLDAELHRFSGKFELLDRILSKLQITKHRVLLFCQMTHCMSILEVYLTWRKMKYLRLDGRTKPCERDELLLKFNMPDSDYFLFMLSTQAGGLRLNLKTADTVIIFDSDWNPEQDLQAQDRAHRIDPSNAVRVLRLVTVNSIEERILAAGRMKLLMDEQVKQVGLFDQRPTSTERQKFLQNVLRHDMEDENIEPDLPNDEMINSMLARNDEDLAELRRVDEERQQETGIMQKTRLVAKTELPSWLLEVDEEMTSGTQSNTTAMDSVPCASTPNSEDTLLRNQWITSSRCSTDCNLTPKKRSGSEEYLNLTPKFTCSQKNRMLSNEIGRSESSRRKLDLDENSCSEAEEQPVKKNMKILLARRSNRLMLKGMKKKQVMQVDEDSDDDPMPMQE